MQRITQFKGKHAFLSNFWPCRVWLDGVEYPSVECAYQAAKTTDPKNREQFVKAAPGEAKYLGRRLALRKDWENVKVDIMRSLVKQKFQYAPHLRQQLLDTGDAELVEGNTWNDTFWGVDLHTGKGQNMLGRILMEVRDSK